MHCQSAAATPAPPVVHTHPARQCDGHGQFDPTLPSLTPRLNPHRARGTDGASLPRDFVPWRFSDAGLRACGRTRHRRRPKTCTISDIARPNKTQGRPGFFYDATLPSQRPCSLSTRSRCSVALGRAVDQVVASHRRDWRRTPSKLISVAFSKRSVATAARRGMRRNVDSRHNACKGSLRKDSHVHRIDLDGRASACREWADLRGEPI